MIELEIATVCKFCFSFRERQYFRSQLKEARVRTFKNAEDFDSIIYAVEKIGYFMWNQCENVERGRYSSLGNSLVKNCFEKLIEQNNLTAQGYDLFRNSYGILRNGRNEMMHEGSTARKTSAHAIQVSLFIEEALRGQMKKYEDFMVANPVCAEAWQPLRFIKQVMLENSFSYLPVLHNNKWYIVADYNIAKFLKDRNNQNKKLLDNFEELTEESTTAKQNQDIDYASLNHKPILILSKEENHLIGIVTPFDLL